MQSGISKSDLLQRFSEVTLDSCREQLTAAHDTEIRKLLADWMKEMMCLFQDILPSDHILATITKWAEAEPIQRPERLKKLHSLLKELSATEKPALVKIHILRKWIDANIQIEQQSSQSAPGTLAAFEFDRARIDEEINDAIAKWKTDYV